MGLNESNAHVRSQVLMIVPLPNVNQEYVIVLNVESQRTTGVSSSRGSLDPTAFLSNRGYQNYSGGSSSEYRNSSRGSKNVY